MATNNIDKQSFGEAGATFLSGTEGVTKDICAITVIADAVFNGHATTGTLWAELADSTASAFKGIASIPAGVTIYGQFQQVKLTSGTVICYHSA